MNVFSNIHKISALAWCVFLHAFQVNASNPATVVSGVVYDANTGLPLLFASVFFEDSTVGTTTNSDGFFQVQNHQGLSTLIVSSVGFETQTIFVKPEEKTSLTIRLKPADYQLEEVVVRPTRQRRRYSRRNNPAVELMEKVIANKKKNRIENSNSWQFRQYEKLTLSVSNIENAFETGTLFRMFDFLPDYLSTSEFDDSPILTVSIKEVLSHEYRQNNPAKQNSVILGKRRAGIDHLLNIESLDAIYSKAFDEINIFENNLNILMKRFVSPLSSSLATVFYQFFITDTIIYRGNKCIIVDFMPRNMQDFGFIGRLWILPEKSWAVQRVELNIPRSNTVNFVSRMRISQKFEMLPSGVWAKSEEVLVVDFEAHRRALGVQVKRTLHFADYTIDVPFDYSLELESNRTDFDWTNYRLMSLAENEQNIEELLDKMQQVSAFNHLMRVVQIATSGFIRTSSNPSNSRFDIGPVQTFISANSLEGVRFRLGGTTTANFNRHLFFNGYLAYGTRDRVLKYAATITYSFNERRYHENEFRKNNLAFTYSYDVNSLGTRYFHIDRDNTLLSIRRTSDNNLTYRRQALLSYEYESRFGLSFRIWTSNQREEAAGNMQFLRKNDEGELIDAGRFTNSTAGISLRYTRDEQIFQNRASRFSFYRNNPVFRLSYTAGIRGYLNGEYNFHALEASIENRFWLAGFGSVDVFGKAGQIWGEVPFPLLMIPNANQAFFMQPRSFSLMNPMEFINDRYVLLDVQFQFNGVLFNRIPLIRRLSLREVAGFTGIFGSLSAHNDPVQNPALFRFPAGAGQMTGIPYVEANIGIENIFRIFRICYVRRLTYLDNPEIARNGIRFAFSFSF